MDIIYIELNDDEIDLIKPLWENLKEHHRELSTYFTGKYEQLTFKERKEQILKKASNRSLKIDIVKDKENEQFVGYCISSIFDKVGEIDSIYIEKNYRNENIGIQLMKRSLNWMDNMCVKNKKIIIAVGNEELISFYQRFNFYPRHITLEQKK